MNETAFPVPSVLNSNGDPIIGTRGMSLRDYFAAMALNVAIQQTKYYGGIDQKTVAGWCYDMADAMLKEREK